MEKSTVYFTDFRCPVGTSQLDKLKKLCVAAGEIFQRNVIMESEKKQELVIDGNSFYESRSFREQGA